MKVAQMEACQFSVWLFFVTLFRVRLLRRSSLFGVLVIVDIRSRLLWVIW